MHASITLDIKVSDGARLLQLAREHSLVTTGADLTEDCRDIASCLQMLFDPGAGGQAYTGPLETAGISVIQSRADVEDLDDEAELRPAFPPSGKTRLYHVTTRANLPSIQEFGLLPLLGVNALRMMETAPAIHAFFDLADLNKAIRHWWCFEGMRDKIILAFEVPTDKVESRDGFVDQAIVKDEVVPEQISLVRAF